MTQAFGLYRYIQLRCLIPTKELMRAAATMKKIHVQRNDKRIKIHGVSSSCPCFNVWWNGFKNPQHKATTMFSLSQPSIEITMSTKLVFRPIFISSASKPLVFRLLLFSSLWYPVSDVTASQMVVRTRSAFQQSSLMSTQTERVHHGHAHTLFSERMKLAIPLHEKSR